MWCKPFAETLELLQAEIKPSSLLAQSPEIALLDKWLLMSGLQKCIRRGHIDLALQFGEQLLKTDKVSFWRRLLVTAFEDIGVADLDVLTQVTAITSNFMWRRRNGGDWACAEVLIRKMCACFKNRTEDDLFMTLLHHPDFQRDRENLPCLEQDELEAIILDRTQSLPTRSIAMWYYAGTDRYRTDHLAKRDGSYRDAVHLLSKWNIPPCLYESCATAAPRLYDPMPLFLPLIWQSYEGQIWREVVFPIPEIDNNKLPSFIFDPLHTRSGKQKIKDRQLSEPFLQSFTPHQIAQAVFMTESATVNLERTNDLSEHVKQQGIMGSFMKAGLSEEKRQNQLMTYISKT